MNLTLSVCQSAAGFYIGTWDEDGPASRESAEYFGSTDEAEAALATGDWTPRQSS